MRNAFIALILVICLAALCGCDGKEEASRYPSVLIPEYSTKDYYILLSDKSPEKVYNAVCNLQSTADTFASRLSSDKATAAPISNPVRYCEIPVGLPRSRRTSAKGRSTVRGERNWARVVQAGARP